MSGQDGVGNSRSFEVILCVGGETEAAGLGLVDDPVKAIADFTQLESLAGCQGINRKLQPAAFSEIRLCHVGAAGLVINHADAPIGVPVDAVDNAVQANVFRSQVKLKDGGAADAESLFKAQRGPAQAVLFQHVDGLAKGFDILALLHLPERGGAKTVRIRCSTKDTGSHMVQDIQQSLHACGWAGFLVGKLQDAVVDAAHLSGVYA